MSSTIPSKSAATPASSLNLTPAQVAANSSASSIVNDPAEVLGELDGGQFLLMLARAMGSVAAAAVDNEGKGKISIELDFAHIKKTQQVNIKHSLKFLRPTMDGEASEKVARETVMHVGKFGKLTVMPESQMDLIPKGKASPPSA